MEEIQPLAVLMSEHRTIERVLEVFERDAGALGSDSANVERLRLALDFFREYADRRHHGKEEDLLFRAMEEAGLPLGCGPLSVMLTEHEVGRSHLAAIRETLDEAVQGSPEALEAVRGNASGYVELLRAHINKEDNVLYRIAAQMLEPADWNRLAAEFERADALQGGRDLPARFASLVGPAAGA